jgi:3-hydroxyisobutyrate dehydrogenase-like beta-hydroxyacid dehydrogenase
MDGHDGQRAQRIGFVGLGIMGSRQAANLRRAGYELTVFNRTREKAEAFAAEHGGQVASTPREVAERSDIVITMVVDGEQVEEVLLGSDGAAHGARDGTLFVDMSTIGPAAARAIARRLAPNRFLDAPVTGSAPRAADGTLTIMCGGEAEDFERARPVLEAMGRLVLHVGPLGQGQMVKVINNSVAAINAAVIAQALIVGDRTGVDLEALVQVMSAGSGGSTMLDLKAQPMLTGDYEPLFKLAHMLKDVRLCLEEAQAAGAPFTFAALASDLYAAGLGRELGDRDFAAVMEVLEGLAGQPLHR